MKSAVSRSPTPDKRRRCQLLRSEMMLDNFGVIEDTWRDALSPALPCPDTRRPQPGFAASESPRYVGRAVAALAARSRQTPA